MALFDKALKYSYIAQKRERHKILKVFLIFLILFIIFNIISAFIISVWVLDNETMQPGLQPGDRFFVLSSSLQGIFGKNSAYKRGSVVLLDRSSNENPNSFLISLDSIIRFFTAQKINILGKNDNIFIKRLIALPGDEVSMADYVLKIRPSGGNYFLTEYEFAEYRYELNIPNVPALWNDTLPLSGNMETITLGPDEYFVVSDDRLNSGDSRTWGPVSSGEIIGRPIFRFWPLGRIGRP